MRRKKCLRMIAGGIGIAGEDVEYVVYKDDCLIHANL